MVAENPAWGAPRISGELRMLGFDVSQRTVARSPLVQHLSDLLPVPLSNPDTHTMIGGLHVHTVRPTLSFREYLDRYIFIRS